MKIIKLYIKPNNPLFMHLIKRVNNEILVNYPLDITYRKRNARWLDVRNIYIDWIREFTGEK